MNECLPGTGRREEWDLLFNGYRVLILQDEFWEWTVVMVVQQYVYT